MKLCVSTCSLILALGHLGRCNALWNEPLVSCTCECPAQTPCTPLEAPRMPPSCSSCVDRLSGNCSYFPPMSLKDDFVTQAFYNKTLGFMNRPYVEMIELEIPLADSSIDVYSKHWAMFLDGKDTSHTCFATSSSVVVPYANRQSAIENEREPAEVVTREGVVQIQFVCPTELNSSHEHPNIVSCTAVSFADQLSPEQVRNVTAFNGFVF